jgi:hypothetical protein
MILLVDGGVLINGEYVPTHEWVNAAQQVERVVEEIDQWLVEWWAVIEYAKL